MEKLLEILKERQELSIDFQFDADQRAEFKKDSDFIFKTINRIEKIEEMQSAQEIKDERERILLRIADMQS